MSDLLQSILDEIVANIVIYVAVLLVGALLGVLGTLMFGKNYKKRIAALEARSSPHTGGSTTIFKKNIFIGDRSVTEIAGNVYNLRVAGDPWDARGDDDDASEAESDSTLRVTDIQALTQAEYDALPTKNETTLYLTVDRPHP